MDMSVMSGRAARLLSISPTARRLKSVPSCDAGRYAHSIFSSTPHVVCLACVAPMLRSVVFRGSECMGKDVKH